MRITKIYVFCCKNDLYLTRICVASLRYWNQTIPVNLVKDLSYGEFDTSEMERIFQVSIAPIKFKNLGFYSKLFPFMATSNERALLIDSDIVWLGDMVQSLESYDEDLIIQSYSPSNAEEEMNRWFFDIKQLRNQYSDYEYPGFLFNCGQMVVNTLKFSEADFEKVIKWKEGLAPHIPGVFIGEDQGILNYVVAIKYRKKEISLRSCKLFIWGWSSEARNIKVSDVISKKQHPFLIHWYGAKNGLISFLPNSKILKFYELLYYSKIKHGIIRLSIDRLARSLFHFKAFVYELLKQGYFKLKA